jgi:hypothetical protein
MPVRLHRARATRLQAARTPCAEIYPQALPALCVEDVHEPALYEHDLDGALAFIWGSPDVSADPASLSDREAARTVSRLRETLAAHSATSGVVLDLRS